MQANQGQNHTLSPSNVEFLNPMQSRIPNTKPQAWNPLYIGLNHLPTTKPNPNLDSSSKRPKPLPQHRTLNLNFNAALGLKPSSQYNPHPKP